YVACARSSVAYDDGDGRRLGKTTREAARFMGRERRGTSSVAPSAGPSLSVLRRDVLRPGLNDAPCAVAAVLGVCEQRLVSFGVNGGDRDEERRPPGDAELYRGDIVGRRARGDLDAGMIEILGRGARGDHVVVDARARRGGRPAERDRPGRAARHGDRW